MQYYVSRVEWSVHFNVSPDGKMCRRRRWSKQCRGAKKRSVDLPVPSRQVGQSRSAVTNAQQMIMPGKFKTERLVNLGKHDYSLEPKVTFTPDMKWVVFRSTC